MAIDNEIRMAIDNEMNSTHDSRDRFSGLAKRELTANVVLVYRHRRAGRGMELSPFNTRCVRRGEIHEIVLTAGDRADGDPVVADVAYLGFAEFQHGGVLVVGDEVTWRGQILGNLLGFDMSHTPNHLNVIVATPAPASGEDMGVAVEDPLRFIAARR